MYQPSGQRPTKKVAKSSRHRSHVQPHGFAGMRLDCIKGLRIKEYGRAQNVPEQKLWGEITTKVQNY